ncbi:MAG: hypothetical protein SOR89_05155 [Ndongobacter sp.]|nr:hypothetical protein [Ndongobacter sp.]
MDWTQRKALRFANLAKVFFLFVFAFSLVCQTEAFASSNELDICYVGQYTSEEKSHSEELIKEILSQEGIELRDAGEWKVEYGTPKTISSSGYAGNQPSRGTRFNTGGGFYFSSGGGPSVSVGVSFPSPYGSFTVSCNLGNVGASGRFVTVPSSEYYYKLYVTQYKSVKPSAVYKKVNGVWQLWLTDYTVIDTWEDCYAVRV